LHYTFICIFSLNDFKTKLQRGDLKFEEVETMLGHQFKDDYDKIETEMIALGMCESIIPKRIQQLKQVRELACCVRGAQTILEFQGVFNLTGNFRPVENIAAVCITFRVYTYLVIRSICFTFEY